MQLTDFQVTVYINFYLPLFSLKTSRTSTNKHRANQITFHTFFRKRVYKERITRENISQQRECKEFKRYFNYVHVFLISTNCPIESMRFLGKTTIEFLRACIKTRLSSPAFDMEIIFHAHANKTHFHKKGCAIGLILKVRVFGTRPILPIRKYS